MLGISYFLPFNPIYAYRYGWALNFLSIHGSLLSYPTPELLHAAYLRVWNKRIITSLLVAVELRWSSIADLFVTSELHFHNFKKNPMVRRRIFFSIPLRWRNWPDSSGVLSRFLMAPAVPGHSMQAKPNLPVWPPKAVRFVTDGEVETSKCVTYICAFFKFWYY